MQCLPSVDRVACPKGMQVLFWLVLLLSLMGCASVPLAPAEDDQSRKTFAAPSPGRGGIYVFRDTIGGATLKKSVYLNGHKVGETSANTYLYVEAEPGEHVLATESEFGNNDLPITIEAGAQYYFRQFMKMGIFVAGAILQPVSVEEGRKGVQKCRLVSSQKIGD